MWLKLEQIQQEREVQYNLIKFQFKNVTNKSHSSNEKHHLPKLQLHFPIIVNLRNHMNIPECSYNFGQFSLHYTQGIIAFLKIKSSNEYDDLILINWAQCPTCKWLWIQSNSTVCCNTWWTFLKMENQINSPSFHSRAHYWNLGIWVRLGFNFRSGIGI